MALTQSDVKRIRRLGYRDRDFIIAARGERFLLNRGGACVFLGGGGCSIYPYRPMGCRLYPLVYDPATRRSVLDAECPHRGEFMIREDDTRRLRSLVKAIKRERRRELVE